jgi:hypothetical protein
VKNLGIAESVSHDVYRSSFVSVASPVFLDKVYISQVVHFPAASAWKIEVSCGCVGQDTRLPRRLLGWKLAGGAAGFFGTLLRGAAKKILLLQIFIIIILC